MNLRDAILTNQPIKRLDWNSPIDNPRSALYTASDVLANDWTTDVFGLIDLKVAFRHFYNENGNHAVPSFTAIEKYLIKKPKDGEQSTSDKLGNKLNPASEGKLSLDSIYPAAP